MKNHIKKFLEKNNKGTRNNEEHPWKKAWSKRQAKDEKERRKEMQRLNIE